MPFFGQDTLNLHPQTDGCHWLVTSEGFGYQGIAGLRVTVPRQFQTDGASIPRFFWRLIGAPMTGRHRTAAIIHDVLYRLHVRTRGDRLVADALFYDMLRELECPRWKANAMYYSLRMFGGLHAKPRSST